MANQSLLAKAENLRKESPAGADLLIELKESQTQSEILAALERYDSVMADWTF